MKTTRWWMLAALAVLLVGGVAFAFSGTGLALRPDNASAAPALFSEEAVTTIYDNAIPAVVEVRVVEGADRLPGTFLQQGQGSGFLVDNDGHLLTNYHVVDGASTVRVVLKGGNTVNAQVVGTDRADDLALLKVDAAAVAGITPLQLGDSTLVKPGQMAIALGSPFGLNGSITMGVISGLDRVVNGMTGLLQTDAAINPGNSGGPLLNSRGEVIGINTAIESPSTGARGIGFAVSSNMAKKALPDLTAGGQLARPWLGISGLALTPAQSKTLGLSVDKGVYVVTVVPDSPAAKAGLKGGGMDASGGFAPGGDVITTVDAKAVAGVNDLSGYFNTKKVGDSVTLTVWRDGKSLDIPVTLGAWPDNLSPGAFPRAVPQPRIPTPRGWPFRQGFPGLRP